MADIQYWGVFCSLSYWRVYRQRNCCSNTSHDTSLYTLLYNTRYNRMALMEDIQARTLKRTIKYFMRNTYCMFGFIAHKLVIRAIVLKIFLRACIRASRMWEHRTIAKTINISIPRLL